MKTLSQPRCEHKVQISSVDPEIVSTLLVAAEFSRLRTGKFMESRYPETRAEDSFWKSYFHKHRA